ncbi:hypothetical protein SLOPH_1146 [Spraguea lophii 42_110]|uniref:Uncharacterized protein n=1 Tax=Spraguea lophii (strain 42_110) TaxID=1358809 RepID=S7XHC2_SPRLO|nr:hypothetical protein SLOPH_1146 [Spraguea lophii 42_110]
MSKYIFKSFEAEVKIKISPKYLKDIECGLDEYLQKFLLRYSFKSQGFILYYNILGFDKNFKLKMGDALPIVTCLVEFYILCIKEGDSIEIKDEMFLGIYPIYFDAERNSIMKIVEIDQRSNALPSIKVCN